MTTRYVNPASSGGDGTTNALSGANAAYASISAAEAALPGTLSDAWEIVCETDGTADGSGATFSGFTTSSVNTLTVYATGSYRHSGVWDTAKYRISRSAGNSLTLTSVDYVTFDGLQIETTVINANNQHVLGIAGTFTSGNNQITIKNCILRGANSTSFTQFALNLSGTNAVIAVLNCIVYNLDTAAGNRCITAGTATVSIYSTTTVSGNLGINRSSGTLTVKNCYAGGSGGNAFNGTMTMTTCASSDATGSSGLTSIAVNTSNFTNVTGGSEDFHLPVGSALIDVGTDTSGESAPLNFTTDIDGETRSGTWDIGADEYVSGGSNASFTGSLLSGTGVLFDVTIVPEQNETVTGDLLVGEGTIFLDPLGSSVTITGDFLVGTGTLFVGETNQNVLVVLDMFNGTGQLFDPSTGRPLSRFAPRPPFFTANWLSIHHRLPKT